MNKKAKIILDIFTIIACIMSACVLSFAGDSKAIVWIINAILWVVITFLDCIKK